MKTAVAIASQVIHQQAFPSNLLRKHKNKTRKTLFIPTAGKRRIFAKNPGGL
ncbi:hypothetical protein [Desulforamulus aeronauticus]|uniref:hypothetical protein n=1 Tax=Desulforamulus aeronauticus TaxID=53343 RepID=UPI001A9A3725|nr:hypothetical protein [Desulforamulus aeronauticus]